MEAARLLPPVLVLLSSFLLATGSASGHGSLPPAVETTVLVPAGSSAVAQMPHLDRGDRLSASWRTVDNAPLTGLLLWANESGIPRFEPGTVGGSGLVAFVASEDAPRVEIRFVNEGEADVSVSVEASLSSPFWSTPSNWLPPILSAAVIAAAVIGGVVSNRRARKRHERALVEAAEDGP